EAAKTVGAMVVVDNTFATPLHQKPLLLGADLVVHSATKALGGHNDLMAGVIACPNKEHYDGLWFTRQAMGCTLDAYSASLLERGLKTFELRSRTMTDNAMKMALFLESQPLVSNLSYPGLPSSPGNEIAAKQMRDGFGGIMSFDVGETIDEAKKFITNLNLIYHAVSLGATESLICVPYLTTMLYLPEERRLSFGVNKNTVRLSAGIENGDALLEDLKQAFAGM
ncbi:MAG: PLP-dependent transferase, partial [Victivallales bacterium]|nr:PLP-dependent transferase [Victivallales bacterium]